MAYSKMKKGSSKKKSSHKKGAAKQAKQAATMSKVAQGKNNPKKKAKKTLRKSY